MSNKVFQPKFLIGMTILLSSCTSTGSISSKWIPLDDVCIFPGHEKELQFAKDWVLQNRSFGDRPIRYCLKMNSAGITITFIPGYASASGTEAYFLDEGGQLLFDSSGNFSRYIAGIHAP